MKRSGWLAFAGVSLIVTGIMRILDSIWAFRDNGTVVDSLQGAVLGHSLTTSGVIWLIVGITSVVAGFLVVRPGSLYAEVAGKLNSECLRTLNLPCAVRAASSRAATDPSVAAV
jgi:hypothetical protein